ncbi:response regulator [Candidatus Falkowbacteria bacterium]|nr:response regulator [Candidatus Falkowbacteria bacterium]
MEKRILVVEDDGTTAEILKDFLKMQIPEAEIEKVDNLADADQKLKDLEFDLVITDGIFPAGKNGSIIKGSEGFFFANDICDICNEKRIPVIVVSGNPEYLQSQASAVFIKGSFRYLKLTQKAKNLLNA